MSDQTPYGFDGYDVQTVQDATFAILNDSGGEGTYKHILKGSELNENDKARFKALSNFLGLSSIPENLGAVNFKEYRLSFYYGPQIVKEDDKVFLTLGANSQGQKALKFEIIVDNKEWFLLDSQNEKREFTVDKLQESRKIDDTVKTVITPVLIFENGDDFFQIRFKVVDDFAWLKFVNAFKKGDFSKFLEQVDSVRNVSYASISKLFSSQFADKTFPVAGYVLPVTGVEFRLGGQYGPQLFAYVDTTGIPGYCLDFGLEIVAVSDVGVVSFSHYHNGFKQAEIAFKNGGSPSRAKPWFLWVKAQGKAVDTVPGHLIVNQMMAPLQAAMDAQPAIQAGANTPALIEKAIEVESVTVSDGASVTEYDDIAF